jgi:hypothetical protein
VTVVAKIVAFVAWVVDPFEPSLDRHLSVDRWPKPSVAVAAEAFLRKPSLLVPFVAHLRPGVSDLLLAFVAQVMISLMHSFD